MSPTSDAMSPAEARRLALELVAARLPAGWSLSPSSVLDLVLTSPDGIATSVMVDAKNTVARRDLAGIEANLRPSAGPSDTDGVRLVTARYLSPPVREELRGRGLSFADTTGNIELSSARPGLFVRDVGADADPFRRSGRPRGTLKGEPAARVVRALVDRRRSWKATELVKAARTSVGATYRVVDYLESEGLVTMRDDTGTFTVPDWRRLLEAWSADFNTFEVNRVSAWIAPRGVQELTERVGAAGAPVPYAATASVAAATWAPYAPVRSAFFYAEDARAIAETWDLRRADQGANVFLLEPTKLDDVALFGARARADGLVVAAPSQVAVDLLHGPGRSPSEAEELLSWMTDHEDEWRS